MPKVNTKPTTSIHITLTHEENKAVDKLVVKYQVSKAAATKMYLRGIK